MSTEPLVPDELMDELVKESRVNFNQLDASELAAQLTLVDFGLFRDIEPTEYIDNLFELKSNFKTPHLDKFEEVNFKNIYY